ncbi:MAG TPA: cobalamin-binding protein [Terriglobales bacterium]|jgi:iron complex transport system substrate-binding protein
MRICSLLPSGTEILFALGLGDSVKGVTFECDYPAEARARTVVVTSKLPHGLSQQAIDRQVKEFSLRGESLYRLDLEKLQQIAPELIVTQDLCHVCASAPGDLGAILPELPGNPAVLALHPHTIHEVWQDILTVGDATGRASYAKEMVRALDVELAQARRGRPARNPRVLCLEWLDPPFTSGHWVPEMVEIAGGVDVLGRAGEPSFEISWQTVAESDPDIILAMPCGYYAKEIEHQLHTLEFPPEWHALRAVRSGNVFAMDANSHFSRPGPRLAAGTRVLNQLFLSVGASVLARP